MAPIERSSDDWGTRPTYMMTTEQRLQREVERLREAIRVHRKGIGSEFLAETPTEPDATLWAVLDE